MRLIDMIGYPVDDPSHNGQCRIRLVNLSSVLRHVAVAYPVPSNVFDASPRIIPAGCWSLVV